ncbi:MAG TPA: 2-isopropylmalate synthase [Bryobacteraceae bacterium]|nr:2-isopropylmalate synthase [Bryobacteraceae bacterium]HPU72469.1 2-isopropylmalate synthase [Bryobacteraceae bacterium]
MSEKVDIFDTTLRDGEQAAGTRLGSRDKLNLARQLARLKVDVIEAGYPASSPEDFQAVQTIAKEIRGPVICALSRAVPADIEACGKALARARRPRIHTGIGVSDIHILGKFRDPRYGKDLAEKKTTIIKMAVDAVKLARSFADDVQFYAEDAGRADPAYLFEVLEAVIDAGATVVNIPDTTGYCVPEQFGGLIRAIREKVRNIARAKISVHCHNDLGMAVANALAGVKNGARQVEGTINGVGERAGNAALEEVVMALRTRSDYFGVTTGIETREFCRTSRLVADMLGMAVPPNKAVVGGNAFAHSSGIHVDGVLKDRETYEIMRPEDVGFAESRVVLTARTGRAGLRARLEKLGYKLSQEELNQTYQRFLLVADKKQEVFDEDLIAILHDQIQPAPELYQLEYLQIYSGTSAIPTATVRLRVKGETKQGASIGDGPVDAVCKAISQVTGTSARLSRYEIRAVTSGTEAIGEVTVHLEEDGRRVMGRGASTDVVEASARAFINGLNQLALTKGSA